MDPNNQMNRYIFKLLITDNILQINRVTDTNENIKLNIQSQSENRILSKHKCLRRIPNYIF